MVNHRLNITTTNPMTQFSERDKVIWDSHFGYDIGLFIGEGVEMETYEIELFTGRCQGELSVSKSEVFPYSKELIKTLSLKYGYHKDWSEIF
jgi:hypothetical protein